MVTSSPKSWRRSLLAKDRGRALGVDWGGKRIGVAVGDPASGLARPCPHLVASGKLATDAGALDRLARREEVSVIVIGLPVHHAEDQRMVRITSQLAEHLRARGWRVDQVDESLTSVEAEAALRGVDLTAAERRKRLDGEAACRILERWFALQEEEDGSA